jgi:hypothetical protein
LSRSSSTAAPASQSYPLLSSPAPASNFSSPVFLCLFSFTDKHRLARIPCFSYGFSLQKCCFFSLQRVDEWDVCKREPISDKGFFPGKRGKVHVTCCYLFFMQ